MAKANTNLKPKSNLILFSFDKGETSIDTQYEGKKEREREREKRQRKETNLISREIDKQ